jgi:5-methylthioribose kinase
METAFAPTARFVAFVDAVPVELRDVEDLHDADLHHVLADRLADAGAGTHRRAVDAAAVAAATGVARLVAQPGRAALLAHELAARSRSLLAD